VPENLWKYYPQNYYSFQSNNWIYSILKKRRAYYNSGCFSLIGWAVSTILGNHQGIEAVKRAKISKTASILDVGCGSGDLLLLLHSLGYRNLTGIDPFVANDICHQNGVNILKKDIFNISHKYDVVMSHHSFEHMANPIQVLEHISRLLNPDGTVIVRLPIAGTFAWKTYGTNWVQLDPPRHIFLPTVTSMKILADKVGLKLGEVIYESNEFQFWGSEQYRNDIPLLDQRSQSTLIKKALKYRQTRRYRAAAAKLNADGQGDSACFYFHKL
jgi:SAM-dependent methyltransferase